MRPALCYHSGMDSDLVAGLLDDAAVFPPGNLPLDQAVPAHLAHLRSPHARLVGPLVVAAKDLGALAAVLGPAGGAAASPVRAAFDGVSALDGDPALGGGFALGGSSALGGGSAIGVAVTVPLPQLAGAVAEARAIPGVRLEAVEVVPTGSTRPDDLVAALADAAGATVFVEVPRDDRRDAVLSALAGTAHRAKFRTGGVRAELYPSVAELAGSVCAAVRAGVPFKATAGLHHALRNTDPVTGFDQHGFLNLLLATAAALDGATADDLAALLAERDGGRVAERVRGLDPAVRSAFLSFGTCSIDEPVQELVALGLLGKEAL